jgi:hypothetical protein
LLGGGETRSGTTVQGGGIWHRFESA